MSEPNFGVLLLVNNFLLHAFGRALIESRLLAPSEIAPHCRRIAEEDCSGDVRDLLLFFADAMETDATEAPTPKPRWTPEVVPGGKDDSSEDDGGEAS